MHLHSPSSSFSVGVFLHHPPFFDWTQYCFAITSDMTPTDTCWHHVLIWSHYLMLWWGFDEGSVDLSGPWRGPSKTAMDWLVAVRSILWRGKRLRVLFYVVSEFRVFFFFLWKVLFLRQEMHMWSSPRTRERVGRARQGRRERWLRGCWRTPLSGWTRGWVNPRSGAAATSSRLHTRRRMWHLWHSCD